MADGLLLSRRERVRAYWEKAGLAAAPSLPLALLALALGASAVALVVAVVASLAAVTVGSSVRTRRGAAIAGVVVALGLVLLQLAIAWLLAHPILPGS